MITVIIPYYQNTPGILARALRSIATQQPCPLPVHVIVVDDSSPAPAGPELVSAGPTAHNIQVITQANGGPGAARNTGLDNAPPDTRYIAFLDSDDEWMPDHLARAFVALDQGYDFYFANHYQLGQTTSAFARADQIQSQKHPVLHGLPMGLHAYQGDMLDQIIMGNVIGTSTVVFDFQRFKRQRFKIEFSNAGEDYLFWMEVSNQNARIAFSSQCEARYGKGVNIYSGSGWGSDQHLLRVHNELKFRKITRKLFSLTSTQLAHIATSISKLRTAFARDLLHRVTHRKQLPFKLLMTHLMLDPSSYLSLPFTWIRIILGKS